MPALCRIETFERIPGYTVGANDYPPTPSLLMHVGLSCEGREVNHFSQQEKQGLGEKSYRLQCPKEACRRTSEPLPKHMQAAIGLDVSTRSCRLAPHGGVPEQVLLVQALLEQRRHPLLHLLRRSLRELVRETAQPRRYLSVLRRVCTRPPIRRAATPPAQLDSPPGAGPRRHNSTDTAASPLRSRRSPLNTPYPPGASCN